MQAKIKLSAGRYKAISDVTLSLFCGPQEKEYRVVKAAEEFDVPKCNKPFGYFATYHPDFGDAEPTFERLQADDA